MLDNLKEQLHNLNNKPMLIGLCVIIILLSSVTAYYNFKLNSYDIKINELKTQNQKILQSIAEIDERVERSKIEYEKLKVTTVQIESTLQDELQKINEEVKPLEISTDVDIVNYFSILSDYGNGVYK